MLTQTNKRPAAGEDDQPRDPARAVSGNAPGNGAPAPAHAAGEPAAEDAAAGASPVETGGEDAPAAGKTAGGNGSANPAKADAPAGDAPAAASPAGDGNGDAAPVVLVVHASVGSGHRSAAIAIGQMIEKMRDEGAPAFPDGSPIDPRARVEIIDALDYGRMSFNGDKVASSFTGASRPFYDFTWRYTFTGRLLWGGGTCANLVMFPRFTKLVEELKPKAVIATHIVGANIAVGARLLTRQSFPVVSVPTDYETEGLWPHEMTDAFCVGTEYMAETLRARRIPEERIHITGIPTRTEFLEQHDGARAREEFGLPADKKVVAILAGASLPAPYRLFRESIDAVLPYLHRYTDMHFVITAGRDEEYAAYTRRRIRDLGLSNVTVLGYCTQMAKLMSACDLAVCKSGGLTVTECLCASTPMILMGRAYGQEKANMNMLTGNGAAMHVTTPRELRAALDRFSANPQLLDSMLFNANLLRKPNAARDVVRVTCELIARPQHHKRRKLFDRFPALFLVKFYIGQRPAHIR